MEDTQTKKIPASLKHPESTNTFSQTVPRWAPLQCSQENVKSPSRRGDDSSNDNLWIAKLLESQKQNFPHSACHRLARNAAETIWQT